MSYLSWNITGYKHQINMYRFFNLLGRNVKHYLFRAVASASTSVKRTARALRQCVYWCYTWASVVTVALQPCLSPYSWTEKQQVVSHSTGWSIPSLPPHSSICFQRLQPHTRRGVGKVSVPWQSWDCTNNSRQRGEQREEVESSEPMRLSCTETPPETWLGFARRCSSACLICDLATWHSWIGDKG